MNLYHDSRSIAYRRPQGAAESGSTVELRVRAEGVNWVELRLWQQNAEVIHRMKPIAPNLYSVSIVLPETPGLVWYCFRASDDSGKIMYYGNARDRLGGMGEMSEGLPPSYQITAFDPEYETPKWLREGVMMQIMVDRFYASRRRDADCLPAGSYYHVRWNDDPVLVVNDRRGEYCNNDFFGGDLNGITEKLDYIADLGATVIYLNPIFRASSNHKYNTGNYREIAPEFGTEQDFEALCVEAKKRGIRIMIDGVFSHTGSDSVYFNEEGTYGSGGAYNDPNSPYRAWYDFKSWPDDYDCWWGVKTLPNVREEEESYREFILTGADSVLKHWLRAGASGWRLDVADELPMPFLRELRLAEKSVNPDAAVLGEVWEDPSNKVSYNEVRSYCLGDTLDCAMNYPLRECALEFMLAKIDAGEFARRVSSMAENQPKQFFYSNMNLLGSHDRARALAVLADVGDMEPERRLRRAFDLKPEEYARGKRRLIAAWNLICALPGMPCVYYGDEAGLYGMGDPFCRGTYPWGNEDKELIEAFRTAIQRRRHSRILQTGEMAFTACGTDVVIVERKISGGKDAFGNAAKNGVLALAINRACESRWIEYAGKTVELKPESAAWLEE